VIKYRLRCACAHEFEAWFPSSASCETQAEKRQICCPDCGGRHVGKAVMAPNVAMRGRGQVDPLPVEAIRPQMVAALREVRRSLLASAEDVGPRFPEEARRIHHGETEARRIRGTASGDEARALLDEGIEIVALPALPEDAN
jgi:hypothetical protein